MQNAGTRRAISFSARSLKSSVSSMPVNVSRRSMSRISAGSTNRSALGTGICSMTKAATLLSLVCIGLAVTTASAVPPPATAIVRTAFPSRSAFTASSRVVTASLAPREAPPCPVEVMSFR